MAGPHGYVSLKVNPLLAYKAFKETFYNKRFAALRVKGTHMQRPLWASTGQWQKCAQKFYLSYTSAKGEGDKGGEDDQ